jgi:hypothetical protein
MAISQGKPNLSERSKHWEQSKSIESFLQHAKGKTLEELRFESGTHTFQAGPVTFREGLGPLGHTYVRDPLDPSRNGKPGGVIDMKHFIGAASVQFGLGEYTGAGVEIQQSTNPRTQGSAHFEEDYKSNFLGVVFRNNYWKNDNDVSNEFRQFFQDYQKGQLKGFWPTVNRATAELGKQGASGLKKLEQLADFVTDYATHLGQQGLQQLQNFRRSMEQMLKINPVDGIRKLIDQISLAEQTIIAQQGVPQKGRGEVTQQFVGEDAISPQRSAVQPSDAALKYAQIENYLRTNLGVETVQPHHIAAIVLHQSNGNKALATEIVAAGLSQQFRNDPATLTAVVNQAVQDGSQARLDQLAQEATVTRA